MIRVFVEEVGASGDRIELSSEERHYLLRVRRCAVGDAVELIGKRDGLRGIAVLVEASATAARLEINEVLAALPSVFPVRVLAAVPKRDLLDDVVRKLSEIGASSLVPLLASRSVVLPGESKIERWRRIAEEAMRQCGRGAPLEVFDPEPFESAIRREDADAKLILDPRSPRTAFAEACGAARSIAVAIGPEGGFTESELAFAVDAGFAGVGFGRTVMRVETAAIVASALAVDRLASRS